MTQYSRILVSGVAIVIIWAWLLGSCLAQDTLSSFEGISAKFTAANIAYKAQDYTRAIEGYEAILKSGKESGAIYYNLGNSYFKQGELGRAILNYERARRLMPRDADLNFNLQYVRQRAGQDTVQSEVLGWGAVRQVRWATQREIIWMLVVMGGFIIAGHLWSLWGRWQYRLRRVVIGILVALWFVGATALVVQVQAQDNLAIVFTASEARFEPHPDSTTHFSLAPGARVHILKREDNWAKVERLDGRAGWIMQSIFELI